MKTTVYECDVCHNTYTRTGAALIFDYPDGNISEIQLRPTNRSIVKDLCQECVNSMGVALIERARIADAIHSERE